MIFRGLFLLAFLISLLGSASNRAVAQGARAGNRPLSGADPEWFPITLTFGSVPLHASKTLPDTLKNIGTDSVYIENFSVVNSADFSVNGPTDYWLRAGSSKIYSVTFSPAIVQVIHTGSVSLNDSDSQGNKLTRSVTLIGYDEPTLPVHLSISKRYLAYADSDITISQLLTDTLHDSIRYFREDIEYDQNVLDFIDVTNGAGTPAPDWTITKTATMPGIVQVSAKSNGAALRGPSEILRIIFHVRDSARPLETADVGDSGVTLGTPPLAVISDTGMLRVIDACTNILVTDGAPLTLGAQCVPNPASGRVDLQYDLPSGVPDTRIRLYSLTGNLVRSLLDANETAGRHELMFDVAGLPNGTYFYEVRSGNSRELRMLSVAH